MFDVVYSLHTVLKFGKNLLVSIL